MPLPKEKRRKKLSDYSWGKLHWGFMLSETSDLTDSEFRAIFKNGYRHWMKNDIESMHPVIRFMAEETLGGTTGTVPIVPNSEYSTDCTSTTGTVPIVPNSEYSTDCTGTTGTESLSISLSSLNTNEMSIGGKGEPRRVTTEPESKISPTKIPVAEFLKAGPPIWMQWDFAALKVWNRLPIDYPTLDLNHVIAKAGEYRKKCDREKTETKFIKQPQNWLDAGMWSLNYESEKEQPAHLTYVPCIPFD
jgi:hypothetical protein